jgi:hypothetical protein
MVISVEKAASLNIGKLAYFCHRELPSIEFRIQDSEFRSISAPFVMLDLGADGTHVRNGGFCIATG